MSIKRDILSWNGVLRTPLSSMAVPLIVLEYLLTLFIFQSGLFSLACLSHYLGVIPFASPEFLGKSGHYGHLSFRDTVGLRGLFLFRNSLDYFLVRMVTNLQIFWYLILSSVMILNQFHILESFIPEKGRRIRYQGRL